MCDEAEMKALRLGVGLCRQNHMHAVRITGDDAFELLDGICPRHLFVRDGQMLPTVLLHQDGSIFADVYVLADDLDFVLIYEGPSPKGMMNWLTPKVEPAWTIELHDLSGSHRFLGVHGPYAWELLAETVGPEVVGVGYLRSFLMFEEDALCMRAGKTGEFGYEILVPNERAESLWSRLCASGEDFDAVELSLAALDLAALQNGFFSMRNGVEHLTPVELQLLWRIAWDRQVPGLQILHANRQASRRITWIQAENKPTGEQVLCAHRAPLLGGWVGLALLPVDQADPGLAQDGYRTVAPPLLHNRSLFIDSQRHSWAGRDLDSFPALFP